jgi:polyisoprenoid-binding protein YceI
MKMKLSKLVKMAAAIVSLSLISSSVYAIDWVIDGSNSQLNFVSIKKNKVAEVHSFKQLQGSYDAQGQFILEIALASVDTNNPIRDDRMKNYLFEVSQFSSAKITSNIDTALVDAIAEGASKLLTVDASLDLHGMVSPIKLEVIVSRLVGAKLLVVSAQPVIINAGDFGLTAGITKLMELAKLPSISQAVPISFYVTLKLK